MDDAADRMNAICAELRELSVRRSALNREMWDLARSLKEPITLNDGRIINPPTRD